MSGNILLNAQLISALTALIFGVNVEPAYARNKFVVNADDGKQKISRFIYGHFAEHLGHSIDGGIWVGDASKASQTKTKISDAQPDCNGFLVHEVESEFQAGQTRVRVLLCISHSLGCRYYLGDFKDEKYLPDFHARMSWNGTRFFALVLKTSSISDSST